MSEKSPWTAADEERLISVLDRALLVAAKARSGDREFLYQIFGLQDRHDNVLKEFIELLNLVKSIHSLDLFNIPNQNFLGNCFEINHVTLVRWMISCAQVSGALQTIRNLAKYLESETLEVMEILTIIGISVKEPICINEFILFPWDQLPMTDQKWHINYHGEDGRQLPHAAITRKIQVIRPQPLHSTPSPIRSSLEPMFDVLRCISAVTGAGIQFSHYWAEPPEWVPYLAQRNTFGIDGSVVSMPRELPLPAIAQISACAARFQTFDTKQRFRLCVPMDRLNKSRIVGIRSVDTAIELGIALESLFAPTKLSEGIGYTVRTRAARFLGGSMADRQKVSSTLKDVYDLRSRAVHAGRFDGDQASKKWKCDATVRMALEDGQNIIGRSIVKAILEGEPVWDEFDLSS